MYFRPFSTAGSLAPTLPVSNMPVRTMPVMPMFCLPPQLPSSD